jgi:hypothetical protein
MAGTTRLELATSAVTGQRSNQLNYVPTRFSYGQAKPACCPKTAAQYRKAERLSTLQDQIVTDQIQIGTGTALFVEMHLAQHFTVQHFTVQHFTMIPSAFCCAATVQNRMLL